MLSRLIFTTFKVAAPAWNVQQGECEMLSACYVELIAKYFPDFDLGPELAAFAVTVAVFGPRWGHPRKITPKPAPATPPPA